MNEKRKVSIKLVNHLNYGITLKKVIIFEGKTSGVANGFVIPAKDTWESVIEQNRSVIFIKGKYVFKINGVLAPLSFAIKFEYIHWKDKRGILEFYNSNDRVVQFGHGNIGEKIGGSITGHTDGTQLNLVIDIISSTEQIIKEKT